MGGRAHKAVFSREVVAEMTTFRAMHMDFGARTIPT